MDRDSMLKDFSYKVRKLRESMKVNHQKMGAYFCVRRMNYSRYENGQIFPNFMGLHCFANKTGISLDWLVCSKGPMYYKEKAEVEEKEAEAETEVLEEKPETPAAAAPKIVDDEITTLLDHMERIPLLRHEILAHFYKFKDSHPDLIAPPPESPKPSE